MNVQSPSKNENYEFSVHRFYLKDLSIKSPVLLKTLDLKWEPNIKFDIKSSYTEVLKETFEVVLDYEMNLELGNAESENKICICNVAIKQAGIFKIIKASTSQVEHLLLIKAPSILYPYIQEIVSSTINRAGYPQVIVPYINFETVLNK
jgi:protein-export chaperone SecB